MLVATLVARLEAEIAEFEKNMAAAQRELKDVQSQLKKLQLASTAANKTLESLGADQKSIKALMAQMKAVTGVVDDLATAALGAGAAIKNANPSPAQTAENIAQVSRETAAYKDLRNAALQAAAAEKAASPGFISNVLRGPAGRFIPSYLDRQSGLALNPGRPSSTFGRQNILNLGPGLGWFQAQQARLAAQTWMNDPVAERIAQMGSTYDPVAGSEILMQQIGDAWDARMKEAAAAVIIKKVLSKRKKGPSLFALLMGGAGGGGGIRIPFTRGFGWAGFRGGRFLPGLAVTGSLAGLAGFGAEHVLTSAAGVGGSFIGGLLGGGLLGLGALGTLGVGMGTDMAGLGQAAGDIKNTTGAVGALDKAIQMYGRHSRQAAVAQAQLNYTVSQFSPVARPAVIAASRAANQFHTLFDQVTGPAEAVGAQIIKQGIQTGQTFLPTLGRFSFQNMGIIQKGLQPLFQWLQGTNRMQGLGIFTNLEQIFQKNLPAGVDAFNQGIQVLLKTIDVAAQHTGGFTKKLDEMLQDVNSPAGFAKWTKEINKLIGLFQTWLRFFEALARGVYEVFKPAIGFGAIFIGQLTNIVNLIDKWLSAKGTQDALTAIFKAHLSMVSGLLNIVKALLPVLEQAITDFLKVAAVVSSLTGGALKVFAQLIKQIVNLPGAKWLLGLVAAGWLLKAALSAVVGVLDAFLIKLGIVEAGEATLGARAAVAAGKVGLLRKALLYLNDSTIFGALGRIVGFVTKIAATYLIVNAAVKALQPGTGFDFSSGSGGESTLGAGAPVLTRKQILRYGELNFAKGTEQYDLFRAGLAGQKVTFPPGTPTNNLAFEAYMMGLRASIRTGPGASFRARNDKAALAAINPANILRATLERGIAAAIANPPANISGNTNALYKYYKSLLNIKGLSPGQRSQINQMLAIYTPINLGGPTTGLTSIGTPLTSPAAARAAARDAAITRINAPTSAGGGVFNAEQVLQQAMTPGSGVNTYQQVQLARAFQSAALAAQKRITAMRLPPGVTRARQTELTTLSRDAVTATKDITKILDQQARNNVTNSSTAVALAKQNYQIALSNQQTDRQRITAANQYLAVLKQQYAILERQQDVGRATLQATREMKKISMDEKAARQDIVTSRIRSSIDSILGIGGGGGIPSVARLEGRLRGNLLGLIRRLFHPIGGGRAGEITNPYAMFPGATQESIPRLIKQMQQEGIQIPKSSLRATNEILRAIHIASIHGVKLNSTENAQISAILTQMNQTLRTVTDYPQTYKLASVKDITKGLIKRGVGAHAAEIMASRAVEAEVFGGKLPFLGASQGIPVTNTGANMRNRRWIYQGGSAIGHPRSTEVSAQHLTTHEAMARARHGEGNLNIGQVTINLEGMGKNGAEIAREIRAALLQMNRRNKSQSRGINPGRAVGAG